MRILGDVKVAEVKDGVLVGKKGKLYTVTVTVEQELSTVNTAEAKREQLQYVIKLTAAIAVEEPKLVAIKYRKGYQWYEPHDNIPLTYQYILYRDSVFSDGSVHIAETRSGTTALSWHVDNSSAHGKYGQTIERVIFTNEGSAADITHVLVYYFAMHSVVDNAYGNVKNTRTIAVPDISLVTIERVKEEERPPYQWESYLGYNPAAPTVGWYWSDFASTQYAYLYNNYAGGGSFWSMELPLNGITILSTLRMI